MRHKKKHLLTAFTLTLATLTGQVQAAVSQQEADRLGKDLMPLGGERAGNASGTIPAWDGGMTKPPAGFLESSRHFVDPFEGEQPLFTITKANLDQYRANLTPGQIALFDAYPDTFKMKVYQTRRTGAAPQWVYDNTKKNAVTARLTNDGNSFVDAYGGIAFPIPQSGAEVVWNHMTRYRGTFLVAPFTSSAVVQKNGSFSLATGQQEVLFRYYRRGGSFADLDNVLFYYMIFIKAPPRLAGDAVLVHETIDQIKEPRNAWIYTAGQRRVRRAPNISYDTPIIDSEGMRTADDTDMYNGAPDRYDWELVGKREIYIPYNNYQIGVGKLKYSDILKPGHVNPEYPRYELHRVWVVEGKLKAGARHVYSKRTFYLDEDSWQIAIADQYDGRGELWRVSMALLTNFYVLPTTWSALDMYHDLQSRRLFVMNLVDEAPAAADFSLPVPNDEYFSPAALRRRGTR